MKVKKTLWITGIIGVIAAAFLIFTGESCCADQSKELKYSDGTFAPITNDTKPGEVSDNTKPSETKPTEEVTADPNAPVLEQVHWDLVSNDDGSKEPFVMAPTLLPEGVEFGDIYIFKGDSTDEKDMIGIQTGQKDVDVMYNPEPEKDGRMWCKFAGKVYWFDKPENIPNDDDIVTVVVTGFKKSEGQETPYSNKITAKWGDLKLK